MTAVDALSAGQNTQDIPPRPEAVAMPALSIDGVSHSYGARQALIDIGFIVAPASFTALLGLNGAGKSTLFSLITRLFGIQHGHIGIFGHDVAQAPGEALRLLGVVFQPRTLDLDLSVTQNLLYHAACMASAGAMPANAAARCWRASALPTAPPARSATSPAARCGDWKSRGRCCTARACFCSTRQPSASTSRRAPTSSTTSASS
jgi:ABC-type phosphate transport system ATPase subunit